MKDNRNNQQKLNSKVVVWLLNFDGLAKETKIAISGWLMSSYKLSQGERKTGCAASLATGFVWKVIKI